MAKFAKENDVHLIADEIMTGIGRTGKMLACEHAKIIPDFICLSKGLTSGWMPFSAVLTTDAIYQAFYDDYEKGKSFLHSIDKLFTFILHKKYIYANLMHI